MRSTSRSAPRRQRAPRAVLVLVLCWGVAGACLCPLPARAQVEVENEGRIEAPAAAQRRIIKAVRVTGKILPADGAQGLARFLDIRPGAAWDDQLQSRVLRDLEALGYRADADLDEAGRLTLTVSAVRVVRRIFVSGNWPLFEFEILQNLTWRPGYRLPVEDLLADDIRKQEAAVRSYLHRSGYYDATARITLEWNPERPQSVDVMVRVSLGAGFWRLRYQIGEVKASGFHLLSERQVRGFFEHCCLWLGRTSDTRINEDFKRLVEHYQKRRYAGARLVEREILPDRRRKRVDVRVTIEERKRVEILFTGRKSLSEKELLQAVTIYRDSYYGPSELDESARNIFRLYQQNGFFEAKVGWRWRRRDADPVVVEFLIEEGPRLKVRQVGFARFPGGALSFKEEELRDKVQTRPYPRLGLIGIGEGGYASVVQLEQDVARLQTFYQRQGFPKVRVYPEVARKEEALESAALLGLETALGGGAEDGGLFVLFRIDEGPRETVREVRLRFVGGEVGGGPRCRRRETTRPHLTGEEQARRVLRLRPGQPFSREEVAADMLRLERFYQSVGHPYGKVKETQLDWDPGKTQATLTYVIDEGPEVCFGPILIRGNFVTRESLIRRDLHFQPGDLYDENLLLSAKQNLEQRQIFSYVRVTANPGQTAQYEREARELGWRLMRNPVPVLVEVGERYDNSGEAQLYIGMSTDNLVGYGVPVFGLMSYTWRNIRGTGIEGEIKGELGTRVQSLVARLAEPRLGGKPLRLDLRGFWRNELTASLGPVSSFGGNIELTHLVSRVDEEGRRLPPTLRLFTRLDFAISQILVPLYRTEGTSDSTLGLIGDQTRALKLSVGVVWDRRVGLDAPARAATGQVVRIDPLMPVKGFLLSAQLTGALCCSFPFSADGSFLAVAAQAMGLRPFGPVLQVEDGWAFGMRRFNFKANLRFNWGIPLQPGRPALPVVERFYAGGDTSVRGYYTDRLKVEEIRSPIGVVSGEPAYRVVPQGGNIRLLSSLEWEFAITQTRFGPWMGGLFLDTGAVFDSWAGLRWNDVRFGVGVTLLRLLTSFGPLSLEYAYPLTLPGQESLPQNEIWKAESWFYHFPGRVHFNWGIPLSL